MHFVRRHPSENELPYRYELATSLASTRGAPQAHVYGWPPDGQWHSSSIRTRQLHASCSQVSRVPLLYWVDCVIPNSRLNAKVGMR